MEFDRFAATVDAGRWPVDLRAFDREAGLSLAEQQVLEGLDLAALTGSSITRFAERLPGLLQPILVASQVLGVSNQVLWANARAVLHQVRHTQQTIWAWSPQMWSQLANASAVSVHRTSLIQVAYLLTGFIHFRMVQPFSVLTCARRVFGQVVIEQNLAQVDQALVQLGYRDMPRDASCRAPLHAALSQALLMNFDPRPESLTTGVLHELDNTYAYGSVKKGIRVLGLALSSLGYLPRMHPCFETRQRVAHLGVPAVWGAWVERWYASSRIQKKDDYRRELYRVGRWLVDTHPQITSPEDWTRDLALDYRAAVDNMHIGDWAANTTCVQRVGDPISAWTKSNLLTCVRTFFLDCQALGWIPIRFNPSQCLALPDSARSQLSPTLPTRAIRGDMWAKLVWAGLQLTEQDLVDSLSPRASRSQSYPLEMIRAVAIVWLFGALRKDEIVRLSIRCIEWRHPGSSLKTDTEPREVGDCYLLVPANKGQRARWKPVDSVVGETIEAWLKVRPPSPALRDPKTRQEAEFLFVYKARRLGGSYLNERLIPLLCHKAGVPQSDALGRITAHRGRATIASQLANGKLHMSLEELAEWLGHTELKTTLRYVEPDTKRLTQAYLDADVFRTTFRTFQVLVDQEAIRSGRAQAGEPWRYVDMGHGFCTNDYFVECPHLMACAKCTFYLPKQSSQGQLLEARTNLLRMREEIPLTDAEHAAWEDILNSVDKTLDKLAQLADVPALDGKTPNELGTTDSRMISSFIPLEDIQIRY